MNVKTQRTQTTMDDRNNTSTGIPTQTVVLWFGIISMIMLFAALTSGYMVRRGEGKWDSFPLPPQFLFSTVVIIISSLTLQGAVYTASRSNNIYKALLFATLLLGFTFGLFQFMGWKHLMLNGKFFASNNVSSSFVYAITFLHLAHLIGGILFLLYVCFCAIRDKYNSSDYFAIKQTATYWHFLGILWVYLYIFLTFFR